jgi:predicted dehydrogenase
MTEVVRVGVVGTGWWATQFHLPALQENPSVAVAALADPDEHRLAAAADRFGVRSRFLDAGDLFASGQVDAVVVATPHATHYELAKGALACDLHVLCEKPFVLVSDQARELSAMARARGLHLLIGHTYRFTRHARQARAMVRDGRLGDLLFVSVLFASMVEAYYRGRPEEYSEVFGFPVTGPGRRTYSDPSLSGGGQAQTQVTHAIDMVLWVTGRRPTEVHAYMDNRDLAVDLVDAVAYRLDNGAVGTMGSTGSLRPGQSQQQELRYYGTEGFLLQELIHGQLSFHGNDGTVEVVDPLSDDEVYPAGATSACLVDLIMGSTENLADAESAVATVEFLEAAYASARSGRPASIGSHAAAEHR